MGWLVARRITGPVRALADTAEEVAATQDLSTTIPVQGDDEVGRLARSFNTMLGALADSRRQQHQLVQDASHELRTPLTSLRTSAELLERGHDIDPDERDRLLAVIAAESKELSELVTELVDLATEQRTEEPFAPVALDELVGRVVRLSRDRTGRDVTLDAVPVTVDGNAALLERVVRNLLDNADKFTPPGEPVEVALRSDGEPGRADGAGPRPGHPRRGPGAGLRPLLPLGRHPHPARLGSRAWPSWPRSWRTTAAVAARPRAVRHHRRLPASRRREGGPVRG